MLDLIILDLMTLLSGPDTNTFTAVTKTLISLSTDRKLNVAIGWVTVIDPFVMFSPKYVTIYDIGTSIRLRSIATAYNTHIHTYVCRYTLQYLHRYVCHPYIRVYIYIYIYIS